MTKYILNFLLILLPAITTAALDKQYVYTQISHNEGLTSTVNCIYKEKDGPVWIGTPNGLYSFNGYTLSSYGRLLDRGRRVFGLDVDRKGDMWVLTDRHVFKRKGEEDTFQKMSEEEAVFFCMTEDNEGLWLGSKKHIYRYRHSDNSLVPAINLPSGIECRSICMPDDSTLLCCSHGGKILIDLSSGEISEAPFGNIPQVYASLVDRKGRIWLALYNNGIEVYDKDGTKVKEYRTGNSGLSNDIVLCLEERDKYILAGTDGGGINVIDPETDEIHVISHVSGDPSSFPDHSVKSIHIDDYGNIWAGSIRNGLISIRLSSMNSYRDTYLGQSNGLSNPTVLCLHQDKQSGYIWIGTDGEGINRFDPATASFKHYKSTFKTKVVSIADFSRNELAISTYSDNLWIFDKTTGQRRPLLLSDDDLKYRIRYSGRSINLYNEEDGDLLLFDNSVYRYDREKGLCRPVSVDVEQKYRSNYFIIGRTHEGVWMHNNNTIYLLPDDSERLITKGRHGGGNIRNGHLSKDGIIWLATEEGLCHFDPANGKFGHITTSLFTDANSVVCDNHSRVWVGTEKGLSAYLITSKNFTLFGESDGVIPNEYLPKPHLLSSDGDIYMGGVQGLLHVGDEHEIGNHDIPVLKLTGLSFDGNKIRTDKDSVIKFPRDGKSMQIDISAHEKDLFRHRLYRFTLSENRTYETSEPFLYLSQKPKPGKYTVTASCTLRNGEWSEPFYLMTLKVPQPWFLSWWFICGCILMLASIYVTAIYSINRRKANELKIAMQEQEQMVYEEKVRMLINISHELRTPLTLIMAPLKRLLKGMDQENSGFPVLNRIYRQSRRMQNLLDMVLDLRKMEVSGKHLKIEKLDFNSWLAGCADDIVNEEKAEGINIVYDFAEDVGEVELDRQKCDIVLMNILINAIKHSSEGDTVTISTAMTDYGMVRTSICDQGPGLGEDIDPEKMFTRFYQSKSEKYGSGIGLSYSKILVQMHGGSIGVYNNPDKGATFWWEIPVSASDEVEVEGRAYLNELLGHSSEAYASANDVEAFDTSGMKLMLVDDNQDLLDFLRESMSDSFAEIITVTGGKAAMKEIDSGRLPDMIVSDVNMPEGDGFWLCNEVKGNDRYSHIPFVLLTARGEEQSQSESYRLGADGFLGKPFEVETLMELVKGMLRRKAEIRKRYLDNQDIAQADYGSEEERFIIRLNTVIAENISNPDLDQQLICREMGVSRALLYNKMKTITGAGAKEYITRIRIEKAKALIENTSLTIAEISDMTGFASQSYFSTAFKNYEGMTPSGYKASKKEK